MILKCGKCEYSWKYKGKLKRATCPNCGAKCFTMKCKIENGGNENNG